MSRLKVQGYDSLVRDTSTNAIVNTSTSEYTVYMPVSYTHLRAHET